MIARLEYADGRVVYIRHEDELPAGSFSFRAWKVATPGGASLFEASDDYYNGVRRYRERVH